MQIPFMRYISRFFNRIALIGNMIHLYRIKKANQILKKVRKIGKKPSGAGKVISYLRKINPYVFEELVLTVIENSNLRVIRNTRYSGDGGMDGEFKISRGKVLVQCKRYSSYISHHHVHELCTKVKKEKYYVGVFVHTGRTGEKSKTIADQHKNVIFISGEILVDMILGRVHVEQHIEQSVEQFKRRKKYA